MLKRIAQILILIIPILLFCFLLLVDIAPSGERDATLVMGDVSPFIDWILPRERVSDPMENQDGDMFVSIEENPTYFTVHLPSTVFDEIMVSLDVSSADQPIMEIGGLVDAQAEAYDFQPLVNTLLDTLATQEGWSSLEEDGVTLWQRNPIYSSLADFFEDMPSRSAIGVYAYDLTEPYRLDSYEPLGKEQTVPVSLRGYHQYLTYIKNESFFLSTEYMDMNRTSGADEAAIRVRNEQNEIVYEYRIADDGNTFDNTVSSKGSAQIRVDDLPEGVYRVELSGTSDVFWRSLTTAQRYMTFIDKVYIADDIGYMPSPRATAFYTDVKHLTLETTHAEGVQTMRVGSETMPVSASHEKYTYSIQEAGLVYGYTAVGDVQMTGDGKFAFQESMYFYPDPVSLNAYSDLDVQGVDYVLTSYIGSQQTDQKWRTVSATFPIHELLNTDGSVKFTLSTPEIEQCETCQVQIHAIHVQFQKEPLDMWGFLSALRDRIPFGL